MCKTRKEVLEDRDLSAHVLFCCLRAYVGFEYEDPRGRRFMSSAPDKVMKVASGSGYREFAGRALASDMPLYMVAPTQGRGSKPVHAQLMRMFVVVPDAPVHVLLSPQVRGWGFMESRKISWADVDDTSLWYDLIGKLEMKYILVMWCNAV